MLSSCEKNLEQGVETTIYMDYATEQRFNERLNKFHNDPTLNDCVVLMNDYLYFEDYSEVINIGSKCIDLGADRDRSGPIVYLWMAAAYNKQGDFEKAKRNLEKAINADTQKTVVTSKNINIYSLQNVYQAVCQ